MKTKALCQCQQWPEIINISDWRDLFIENQQAVDSNARFELRQCIHCDQHWLLDQEGLRNVAYAYKLESAKNWQQFDNSTLVKQQMLRNREGHSDETCGRESCQEPAVNGSRYCLEHLYQSGARV